MPYKGEKASKLGHLEVIKSELVSNLIQSFESSDKPVQESKMTWQAIPDTGEELRLIFAVDGSLQTIRSDFPPFKELSFVKTALLRFDQKAVEKVDFSDPHPLQLQDIMKDAAIYHATVLPLKGLSIEGLSNYDSIRGIIYESLKDNSLGSEPFETLKWLAYEKWTDHERVSPKFNCPHCDNEILGLPYDSDEGQCEHCGEVVYLSDMIGFHLEMGEDSSPMSIATSYMLIHETLMLFTGIRFFWENKKFDILSRTLFVKDGPLMLSGQYSKLVIPIRRFFDYSKNQGVRINLVGQEKTGVFVDHLDLYSKNLPENSYFLPNNLYIRKEIQQRPERSEPYGLRTNYGNKIFVNFGKHHNFVLSVPIGSYEDSKCIDQLIGIFDILQTLPKLLSYKHECGLVPIELANGVASLSSYPSAAILKVFSEI